MAPDSLGSQDAQPGAVGALGAGGESVDVLVVAGPDKIKARSPARLYWERLRADRVAIAGGCALFVIVLLAACAPLFAAITHHTPYEQFRGRLDAFGIPRGPDGRFWMGSDGLGRDLFIRVLYGARVSLEIAVLATGLQVIIATIAGIVAGYLGGLVDAIVLRVVDVVLSVPFLLLGISLAIALGPSTWLVILVIAFFGWPYLARVVRGQVISLREAEFVAAARSLGASTLWILRKELLPNVVGLILTYSTLIIPVNIIYEATLSYLGVGVQEPTPAWGTMLAEATPYVAQGAAWWLVVFPGLSLFVTVVAFNLFGDGLRDALTARRS